MASDCTSLTLELERRAGGWVAVAVGSVYHRDGPNKSVAGCSYSGLLFSCIVMLLQVGGLEVVAWEVELAVCRHTQRLANIGGGPRQMVVVCRRGRKV